MDVQGEVQGKPFSVMRDVFQSECNTNKNFKAIFEGILQNEIKTKMQRTENLLKVALDAFRQLHEKTGIQEKSHFLSLLTKNENNKTQAKITRKLLIEHGFSVSKEQYTNSRQINFEEKKKIENSCQTIG